MNNDYTNIAGDIKLPTRPKKRRSPLLPMIEGASKSDVSGENMDIKAKRDFTYSYSCALLPLSDNVSSILKYWARKMIPEECLYVNSDEGIDGYEFTPHVTVKYGLSDDKPNTLADICDGCGLINIEFGKVDKFDTNPNFDVIKVNVESDQLRILNDKISEGMPHDEKWDSYKPHATLAYVKKGECEELIKSGFFTKLNDVIDQVCFSSKTGTEHYINL
jgi:2'-5' RNA ligase